MTDSFIMNSIVPVTKLLYFVNMFLNLFFFIVSVLLSPGFERNRIVYVVTTLETTNNHNIYVMVFESYFQNKEKEIVLKKTKKRDKLYI